ncbi:hypothetical protein [Microbacterium sp. NPDC087592]|uniref:hypothetical protein n=1 Tax=Microbacterium sp. NPDC087592 TaxID=3364193 RepID=UPI00382241FC
MTLDISWFDSGPLAVARWRASSEALVTEVVDADVEQTLAAMSSLTLFAAVGAAAAFVLVTVGVLRDTAGARWGFGGAWMISTCGAALAAVPISLWGVPIAAALSLPILLIIIHKTRFGRAFLPASEQAEISHQ